MEGVKQYKNGCIDLKRGGGYYWTNLYIQYISGTVCIHAQERAAFVFVFLRGSTMQFTIYKFSSKFDLHGPVFSADTRRH